MEREGSCSLAKVVPQREELGLEARLKSVTQFTQVLCGDHHSLSSGECFYKFSPLLSYTDIEYHIIPHVLLTYT